MKEGLLTNLLGDTNVVVSVKIEKQSIVNLCIGLLIVIVISLLIFGIIKKSI